MYDYNKVITGISEYIDTEILSKINDWRKWVLGTGVSVYLAKGTEVFNKIKDMPMIKTLGVIDKNNRINIDLLYREFKKQAEKSAITFDVPMMGPMTLNSEDLDKLYQCITK